jgi:uncharacterized ParB-like nuclease family protein
MTIKTDSAQVTRVQLSSLQIGKRHRTLDKHKVASLAESMKEIGLQQPISVFQNGEAVHLVAGLHRVKAAINLGWEHIDAIVVNLDETDREIWEIDENLKRAGLSKAEELEHFRRRKELWRKRQQEVSAHDASKPKSGPKGGRPKSSYAAENAAAIGLSKSQINRKLAEPKPKKEKPAADEPKTMQVSVSVEPVTHSDKVVVCEVLEPLAEPRPKEIYPAPLSHKPKLEKGKSLVAARNEYVATVKQLGADIESEIDLVTDALREIAADSALH